MQFWDFWLESLTGLLTILSVDTGLGAGLAIVMLTLLLRMALLPVSWSCAYGACIRQKKMKRLQPELERLRQRYRDQPQQLIEETIKVYRRRGMRFIETRPILGALVQMPVLLGMFRVLREGVQQARFLWITNLSRPDFWIAVVAAATTALMMIANPELPEQTRMALIVIPAVIAFIFALKFASGLGLYWVASNCFTAIQTSVVHYVVNRRVRAGTIRI
jgi:YidC/Oxa1 family membrane protein insertase